MCRERKSRPIGIEMGNVSMSISTAWGRYQFPPHFFEAQQPLVGLAICQLFDIGGGAGHW